MSDYRSYPSPQQTPQRGRPSTPSKLLYAPAAQTLQASPAFPQTPRKSKKGSRSISTGLPTPEVTPFPKHSDGSPVKLYTPKEYAEMTLQRPGSSSRPRVASSTAGSPTKPRFSSTMAPPTQRRVASATETPTRLDRFNAGRTPTANPMSPQDACHSVPPRFRTRSSSPTKAPTRSSGAAPVDLVALRKERREPGTARHAVRLLSVISECWGDDTHNYFRWTLKDSLLRGGCEEREPGDVWGDLRRVVGDLWPDLQEWIMHQTPTEEDAVWFGCAGSCNHAHHEYADDPQIDREQSSQERVGFSMSPDAFDAARTIVQELADHGHSFDCLLNADLNPFFMIYAFAHCNVRLPRNFSRQLFWKHLDALVRFQRCPGLKSARSRGPATGTRRVAPQMRSFPREDDPEDIVGTLLALRNTGRLPVPPPLARRTHELLLVIDGARWSASSPSLGRFSYAADDLPAADVAPFALLDALTRWLPHWRAGALEVRTNDVCVMWGVRGDARSRAWGAVRGLCARGDVALRRAELIDHRSEDNTRTSARRGAAVPSGPLRDPEVVSGAVKGLAAPGQESGTAYRAMMRHLML
ncbi:hypothetical protein EDB85DRAFT_1958401 [Lactarius pseudohatsudake]|nr:hypothetical protein EDB85DRAFT_1958401 [Lactarius pseudohatsudake]